MKKILSILLTLCLLLGMTSLIVSATESTEPDTAYLTLDDEYLAIYSDCYWSPNTGYIDFTGGKYVLSGNVGYIAVFAPCDLTFHNLTVQVQGSVPAIYSGNGLIAVNITAIGINSLTSSSCAALSALSVNLTVDENSSISFSAPFCTDSLTSITMSDGTAIPVDDWRYRPLTVSNGTPAAHNLVLTPSDTHTTHTVSCSACDLTYIEECDLSEWVYKDENTCQCTCICGKVYSEPHVPDYNEDIKDYGSTHTFTCYYCEAEITQPHSYEDGYYIYYDSDYCVKVCDCCEHTDTVNGLTAHSFNEYVTLDDDYCILICENCGERDPDSKKLHDFTSVDVPATKEIAAHTNKTCSDCGYSNRAFDYSKTIVFEVSDDCSDGWDGNAIVVYVDGVPTRVIQNIDYNNMPEFYGMEYNPDSSYVFKWIKGNYPDECAAKIYFPGSDKPAIEWDFGEMEDFGSLETIYAVNCADYTAVDAAMAKIPDYLEYYSAASVEKLVTAVKGVQRMLPKSKQSDVDKMATAINTAVSGLVELDSPVPNGVINLSSGNEVCINYGSTKGYTYELNGNNHYSYSGKYVFLETEKKDVGNESYVKKGIWISKGDVEIDAVNTFISADENYEGCFTLVSGANVTLNLFGANAFDAYDTDSAGITVLSTSKLTINDTDGNVLAVGDRYAAGIGGSDRKDIENMHNCGEIHIKGSTVFALSRKDGAGIGGGDDGSAGKITIDGGVIHAECLDENGAGIGCGEDGNGGEIIINGGDIVALCIGNGGDGAGIGGADEGSIDSITINNGTIIAGASECGAAIGGGEDSDYCGKIIINGGTISTSIYHNPECPVIGHADLEEEYEISEKSSVQINGGVINDNTDCAITPAPTTKSGKTLEKLEVKLDTEYIGKDIIITLSDGTTIETNSASESLGVYAVEGTKISSISFSDGSGTVDYDNDDDMFWLWKFFLSIFEWFGSLFQKIGSFFAGLFA